MSDRRDARHGNKPDDMRIESGRFGIGRWRTGAAGSSPGKRGGKRPVDTAPPRTFARSLFRAGPTRGNATTGKDRKGGWLFRGKPPRGPGGAAGGLGRWP